MLKLLVAAVVVFPLLHAVHLAEPADQAAVVRISTNYHANKAACAPMAATPTTVASCWRPAPASFKAVAL